MSTAIASGVAPVIAHTTDLSGNDGAAFLHACALAAAGAARLVTVHGNAPAGAADRLPDAAPLLARWNLAADSDGSSRAALVVDHQRRCHECCEDVTDTLLDALSQISPGLVVTGTQARHGLAALLRTSVSEALARNLEVPTLVVPNRGRGFVDERTGAIDLRRVLIPAGDATTAAVGVAAARALCALAGVPSAELLLLHVGADELSLPAALGPGVRTVRGTGRLDDAIVAAAREQGACVIVMPTHGHDGLRDALLGSHTEHVIRDAGCPVLAVPARPHGEG